MSAVKQKTHVRLPEPSLWHSWEDPEYRRWLARGTLYEFMCSIIMIYIQAASAQTLLLLGNAALPADILGSGFAAFVATYLCMHISGAMLNPALTIGFWFSRRIDLLTAFCFSAAEMTGSIVAAGLLRGTLHPLTGNVGTPRLNAALSDGHGILMTAVLGFIMYWIYAMVYLRGRYFYYRNRYRLHYASDPTAPTHAAIVTTGVMAAAEAVGINFVGSGPNPARWIGPAIFEGRYQHWPVWICGPYIGVLVGVCIYGLDVMFLRPDRDRIDRYQQIEAAHRQSQRQATPYNSRAPPPPSDRLPEFFRQQLGE